LKVLGEASITYELQVCWL